MNADILIGCHVSMSGPDFYLGSVKEALSYNATTFMFYTGAPQNSFRKPLNELKIEEGRKLIKSTGIDETKIVVHAPYIINAANFQNKSLYETSIQFIRNELKRTASFGAKTLVIHPGSHVGLGSENGIKALANALNIIFKEDNSDVKIALETMAGKGSEIGISFDEIAKIISLCEFSDRLGVCLDTCHISDAGYDVCDIDKILQEFNQKIGLNKLLVIHINDSKNQAASHKDRHENIGYGYIGFDTLNKYVHHPLLTHVPKILETPYVNGKSPYKLEIGMFKNGKYINNWREDNF